jgi:hypothetical protein
VLNIYAMNAERRLSDQPGQQVRFALLKHLAKQYRLRLQFTRLKPRKSPKQYSIRNTNVSETDSLETILVTGMGGGGTRQK